MHMTQNKIEKHILLIETEQMHVGYREWLESHMTE